MVTIPLTRGYSATVDETDLPVLSAHKWHAKVRENGTVYAATNIKRDGGGYRWTMMHRLLLQPSDSEVVDHIDGNGLNNSRSNLRVCTQSQNMQNRRSYGRSSFLGVAWDTSGGKRKPWKAMIGRQNLGRYATEDEAAAAYDRAAKELYGEYAKLNAQL